MSLHGSMRLPFDQAKARPPPIVGTHSSVRSVPGNMQADISPKATNRSSSTHAVLPAPSNTRSIPTTRTTPIAARSGSQVRTPQVPQVPSFGTSSLPWGSPSPVSSGRPMTDGGSFDVPTMGNFNLPTWPRNLLQPAAIAPTRKAASASVEILESNLGYPATRSTAAIRGVSPALPAGVAVPARRTAFGIAPPTHNVSFSIESNSQIPVASAEWCSQLEHKLQDFLNSMLHQISKGQQDVMKHMATLSNLVEDRLLSKVGQLRLELVERELLLPSKDQGAVSTTHDPAVAVPVTPSQAQIPQSFAEKVVAEHMEEQYQLLQSNLREISSRLQDCSQAERSSIDSCDMLSLCNVVDKSVELNLMDFHNKYQNHDLYYSSMSTRLEALEHALSNWDHAPETAATKFASIAALQSDQIEKSMHSQNYACGSGTIPELLHAQGTPKDLLTLMQELEANSKIEKLESNCQDPTITGAAGIAETNPSHEPSNLHADAETQVNASNTQSTMNASDQQLQMSLDVKNVPGTSAPVAPSQQELPERPLCGDLVTLGDGAPQEFRERLAVVTKVEDSHCTVVVLDSPRQAGIGECWPSFHDITLDSSTLRVGSRIIIEGMTSEKTKHLNGLTGVISEHPREGHPVFIKRPACPDKPHLAVCIHFPDTAAAKARSALIEPRFLKPFDEVALRTAKSVASAL